ncbi:MAG TPA: protoglobin domain-containing protein [Myxococcales bacterium]|jgi:signal transduction histidine kinase|nr:protoglobin domain-containing protein [Myxococcales bacterium]
MAETLFEELKRYVGFTAGDEAALRSIYPHAHPELTRIADVFYRRILDHEGARKALEGGESTVGRLKITLVAWMDSLLQGPWDEAYYERRARIGRVHVRIALPQQYMFGAMNVLRQQLNDVLDQHFLESPSELRATRLALGKILDLELAIMLHTYREDLLAQQSRVERLSTFGQLIGSIGHELRNPLSVIETSLYILKGRTDKDERAQKHVARIGEQLGIANDIITKLLDMIRDKPLQRSPVDVAALAHGVVDALPRPPGVSLHFAGMEGLPDVPGDPVQLRQVLVNLVENAIHAASPSGRVQISGATLDGAVHLVVEDSGKGVDDAVRARLFEPLITTKAKGIGLGLALVKRIVERHGGTLGYQRSSLGGAAFWVKLPFGG